MSERVEEVFDDTRILNCFGRVGIKTLDDLTTYTERSLLQIRNFGLRCLPIVTQALAERGLQLREPAKREVRQWEPTPRQVALGAKRKVIVERYQQGQTLREIARDLEMTFEGVRYHLRQAKVGRRRPGWFEANREKIEAKKEVKRKEIVDAYLRNQNISQVARELRLNDSSVRRYLHESGISPGELRKKRWEREIALRAEGKTVREIAATLGIHSQTVFVDFRRMRQAEYAQEASK